MKKSLLFGSVLAGMMMMAAPALAQSSGAGPREGSKTLYPGLTWGGLTIFGLSYGAAAVGGALASDACDASSSLCVKGRGVMFVPVVGPFIAAAGVEGIKGTATVQTLLILDGVFQTGGLAMMITGIVLSSQSSRANALLSPQLGKEKKLALVPVTTPTFAGLGAIGRF